MKLFLHIGSGRTGTQALQHFLKRNVSVLNDSNVAYPILNNKNHHNPLALPLCRGIPPRYLANMYGSDYPTNIGHFNTYFDQLEQDLNNWETAPETLVLSSEFLSRSFDASDGETLFKRLHALTSDIEVILYLRNPADYYLSAALQTLKASSKLKPPTHQPLKDVLVGYAQLQPERLHIREYARDKLVDGDICRDFIDIVCPKLADDLQYFPGNRNETISAEIMGIIQDYRRLAWPDSDNKFNDETDSLLDRCVEYAREHDLYRKPILKREITDELGRADSDLAWLDVTYGFRFSNVDYTIQPTNELSQRTIRYVEDICEVDPRVRHEILVGVFTQTYHAEANLTPPRPAGSSAGYPIRIYSRFEPAGCLIQARPATHESKAASTRGSATDAKTRSRGLAHESSRKNDCKRRDTHS